MINDMNNYVYAVTITYLTGLIDIVSDVRTIGVYKDYDKALKAAKNNIKKEEKGLIEDEYVADIVNYEDEWWIYANSEIYAILIINKTDIK